MNFSELVVGLKPPLTWISHAVLALGLALLFGVVALAGGGGLVVVGVAFCIGALLAAVLFNLREQADKALHRARGDYDVAQPGAGATSREDRIGDLLGAYTVAGTAVVLCLLLLIASLL